MGAGQILGALLLLGIALACWPRRHGPRRSAGLALPIDRTDSLAAALESISLCLQSGLTPLQAVEITARRPGLDEALAAVFEEVRRALARGEPGGVVWSRHTGQIPQLRVVAGSWTLTEASGSALEPAVSWAVGQLREKRAAREKLDAVTAGAKSSMGLMLLLPLAGIPIGLLVGVTPRELYGSVPAALSCLAGLACAAGGLVLARRMLRRALRPQELTPVPGLAAATTGDIADASLMLHLALSSGAGIIESLAAVAELSPPRVRVDLRRVVAAYRWGLGHTRAWSYADPAWEPVAAALGLALDHGAAPAASVRAVGLRMSASERSRMEAAAGRAGTFLLVPLAVMFIPSFALTTMIPLAIALVPRGSF